MEEKNKKEKIVPVVLTILLSLFVHTLGSIHQVSANNIDPAIRRITLAKGQRKYASVVYKNSEDFDVEVSIIPYLYNPRTDEISEKEKDIFIKADTDTFTIPTNTSINIKYEIFPIANIREGTYFNILVLTPVGENQDVKISNSIAQLVILDVVSEEKEVKGITTEAYTTDIRVVKKGIPFLTPLVLRYSISNDSNYVITPQGRLDVFNDTNNYKPIYEYVNRDEEEVYPGESFEKEFTVSEWHISDLYNKRIVQAEVSNGLDSNPQNVELEIDSYLSEIFISLTVVTIIIIGGKYLRQPSNEKHSLNSKNKKIKKTKN